MRRSISSVRTLLFAGLMFTRDRGDALGPRPSAHVTAQGSTLRHCDTSR